MGDYNLDGMDMQMAAMGEFPALLHPNSCITYIEVPGKLFPSNFNFSEILDLGGRDHLRGQWMDVEIKVYDANETSINFTLKAFVYKNDNLEDPNDLAYNPRKTIFVNKIQAGISACPKSFKEKSFIY